MVGRMDARMDVTMGARIDTSMAVWMDWRTDVRVVTVGRNLVS